MNIIIPMEWLGTRFSKAWYQKPKPFLDIHGKTMIEAVIDSLNISWRVILILNGSMVDEYSYIQDEIQKFNQKYHNVLCIKSYNKLEWAAKSCLQARNFLNSNEELIVTYCDQIFDATANEFLKYSRSEKFDGTISVYENNDPKDDFIRYYQDRVLELIPKKVTSNLATTWLYYWKNASMFLKGADSMILKNIKCNNEFYVGPIFNENIAEWYKIGFYKTNIYQVWNPTDYENYIQSL